MTEPARAYETPPHEHVAPTSAPVTPVATRPKQAIGSLILRILLTLAGAAGLIVGAFLTWLANRTTAGVDLSARVYFSTSFAGHPAFYRSAGAGMIVLGLVAIVGLAPRSGWLTRLAGALGIVGFVLFVIELVRAPGFSMPGDIGAGAWLCLAGAAVALIGGFFGTRMRVVQTAAPVAAAPYRQVPTATEPGPTTTTAEP